MDIGEWSAVSVDSEMFKAGAECAGGREVFPGVGGGIVIMKTKTSKLVTTNATTGGNGSMVLFRQGSGINEGVVVANGKHYGIAGTAFSAGDLVSGIPQGNEFLCDTFSRFSTESAVSFFRRLKIPLGIREKGEIFPISSGTISVISTLGGFMAMGKIGQGASHIGSLVVSSKRMENMGARSNLVRCTSSIVITANNLSCPGANSAKSKCSFTGRTNRAMATYLPSLITLRYQRKFYKRTVNLSLHGYTLGVVSAGAKGRICSSFKRVLFARFNISNPVVLSTDTRVQGVRPYHCRVCISVGPTLSSRGLSTHVLHRVSRGDGGTVSGLIKLLLPETVVGPIIHLSEVGGSAGYGRLAGRREGELTRAVGGLGLAILEFEPVDRTIVASNKISIGRLSPGAVRDGLYQGLCFTNRIVSISTCAKKFGLRVTFSAKFTTNGTRWYVRRVGV